MGEVFAIAAGACAALDQSIKLFDWIRKAVNSPKDLPKVVEQHTLEISHLKGLVELIETQDALKTETVKTALKKIDKAGEILRSHLQKMVVRLSKNNRGIRVIHALFKGSDEETKLKKIMRNLASEKSTLTMHILLANVGLAQDVDSSIKVNTLAIEELDRLIKEKLGTDDELRIARLIQGRQPNDDGYVTLTTRDLEALTIEDTARPALGSPVNPPIPKEQRISRRRVITNNSTFQLALQINTPIDETDVWENFEEIIITGNKAHHDSTQINYPMPKGVFIEMYQLKEERRKFQKRPEKKKKKKAEKTHGLALERDRRTLALKKSRRARKRS